MTLPELAKMAVEKYIKNRSIFHISQELLSELPPEIKEKTGVFVSIKKKGELRGCIGTFMPTTENVAAEIVQNAISAATKDYRFEPIEEDELPELNYSVDILTEPERVTSYYELDPKIYGIIVKKDFRKGLLLPDLEGVNTVKEQMRIAMLKAGISPDESDVEIFRFRVRRYRL